MAWQEIKHYPNTCKYFEPTESQLWLIVHSELLQKMPSKLLVTMISHAIAAWKNNDKSVFSTILQISHRMLQRKKEIFLQ